MEEMLNDKSKHQERIQQKENKIKKQLKIAKAFSIPCKEPHKLLKRSVLSCGDPKCFLCANPRRVWNEKTIQEQKFEQTEKWKEDVWK
jgi:hypothetical protein